ncbi:Histone-lysine N-methyltransferase [Rhynchospora pubera]|uniref:Histone-lysine N-methyltransferase n=1 Tax=Rhynchospora pubera TaxID=906938 RepID=A0AAV8E027_9POAL|nr:Histone-lysine N-methyltransferase [Rhynchospora pubera]
MASSSLKSTPLSPSTPLASSKHLSQSQKSPLQSSSSEITSPHTPNATPSQNPTFTPARILTPDLCDILSNQIAPSDTDDPAFIPFLRCAQEQLAAYKSLLVQVQNDENAPALVQATHDSPQTNRHRKSLKQPKELVRITASSQEHVSRWREVNRRARNAYESLRCYYHLQHITDPQVRETTKVKVLRSDLKAFTELHKLGPQLVPYLQADKRIVGPIPGVEIGDIFFHRAELCLLGLHGPIQAGIGYAPGVFVEENEPIAASIVASGGYEDDRELEEDVLLYTGSGGKGRNDSHVSADQSLERGNLALERSMNYRIEVRVIRGMKLEPNSGRKLYVYDGLYRVVDCRRGNGQSGCLVYQFKLLRIQGQNQLGSKTIRIAIETKAKLAENIIPSGYVSPDISGGKEAIPVLLFNDVDKNNHPMYGPMMYEYLKSPEYPFSSKVSAMKGCQCRPTCSDKCPCKERNGGTFAYDNGILLHGRPIVYECGNNCHCAATCSNRVTQRGIRYQLEVFRSRDTHWGLRSLDPIQAGTFICEFSGDVVLRDMVKQGSEFQTVLIDPRKFPMRWHHWGNLSAVFPEWKPFESPVVEEQPEYFLDVSRRNNVACYISHSEYPNAFIQFVLYSHDDVKFPRMAVFAMENIPPLRDITLDYGCSTDLDEGDNSMEGE